LGAGRPAITEGQYVFFQNRRKHTAVTLSNKANPRKDRVELLLAPAGPCSAIPAWRMAWRLVALHFHTLGSCMDESPIG
jgi:hypothetical protein